VTAVQVTKVQQPSDWQKRFHEIDRAAAASAARGLGIARDAVIVAGGSARGAVPGAALARRALGGDAGQRRRRVADVALLFNSIPHVVMMATPADLEDLGVGFTLSEGLGTSTATELRAVLAVGDEQGHEVRLSVTPGAPGRATGHAAAI
jgi:hypothetical protein